MSGPSERIFLKYWSTFTKSISPERRIPLTDETKNQLRAIGVVRVVIQSAHISKNLLKCFGRRPKPLATIHVNGKKIRDEQRVSIARTSDPNWLLQAHFALVYHWEDIVHIDIFDHHTFWQRTLIGSTSFVLSSLDKDTTQLGVQKTLLKKDNDTGHVLFDAFYHPVTQPTASVKIHTGIVSIILHEAKELSSDRRPSGSLCPIASISLGWNDRPFYSTFPVQKSGNPSWECSHEFLCMDARKHLIIKVEDSRFHKQLLGHLTISLAELLADKEWKNIWWPLSGCQSGQLMMTAYWRYLDMDLIDTGSTEETDRLQIKLKT